MHSEDLIPKTQASDVTTELFRSHVRVVHIAEFEYNKGVSHLCTILTLDLSVVFLHDIGLYLSPAAHFF